MSINIKYYLVIIIGILFLVQCERPNSPDFTLSRTIEFPFLKDRSITFLGESDALIDTTTESFSDIFIVDEQSFVSLYWEESIDFGSLENAIPEFSFEPELLESNIGPIEIGDFSSGDDLGAAGFQELTGINPENVSPGDQIPAGSTPQPVNISLDTDYFVSATIIEGGLNLELRNELGVDIAELELILFSGNTQLGSFQFIDLLHNSTQIHFMSLGNGTILEDLNVDIGATWDQQELAEEPSELIIQDLEGIDLIASEIVAVVGQQNFSFGGNIEIAIDEFHFTSTDHFVEIETGALNITDIDHNLDLDLELLELSFPDIRSFPFNESDSLVIRFENDQRFARNTINPDDISVDLSGFRIYGEGNNIDYNLYVETEDTQSGQSSEPRTLNENDGLSTTFVINNFQMAAAFGIVSNKRFFLHEVDPSSGDNQVDIYNDIEAEQIDLDGFQDFSGKLTGVEFTDARLSINYQTNIGIPTTIVGAFMGISEDGEEVFLAGKEGEETYINDLSIAEGLMANGIQLDSDQLIQFTIQPVPGESYSSTFIFDRDNSNIIEFLNKLPSEVRFIGISDINREEVEGTITNPIQFESAILFDIPLAIQTIGEAVYTDSLEQDLSDLPGEDDEMVIEEGTIHIVYTNLFPLQVSFTLEFLDINDDVITSVPLSGGPEIVIGASETDSEGFSTGDGRSDQVTISLSNEELRQLYRTEKISYSLGLMTYDQQEVRLRTTDSITISLSTKFVLESYVN